MNKEVVICPNSQGHKLLDKEDYGIKYGHG